MMVQRSDISGELIDLAIDAQRGEWPTSLPASDGLRFRLESYVLRLLVDDDERALHERELGASFPALRETNDDPPDELDVVALLEIGPSALDDAMLARVLLSPALLDRLAVEVAIEASPAYWDAMAERGRELGGAPSVDELLERAGAAGELIARSGVHDEPWAMETGAAGILREIARHDIPGYRLGWDDGRYRLGRYGVAFEWRADDAVLVVHLDGEWTPQAGDEIEVRWVGRGAREDVACWSSGAWQENGAIRLASSGRPPLDGDSICVSFARRGGDVRSVEHWIALRAPGSA